MITLEDLQNLDPNNVGAWPGPVKAAALGLVFLLVLGAGYWFDVQHQIAQLKQIQAKEQDLRNVFETKQRKAANLKPLQGLLVRMEQSFEDSLRLLPSKTEIDSLLVDISQSGLASGLEFELFKPLSEVPKEFYAEQPIQITVTGSYHEFGNFVSEVAKLPRIVTQHDVKISPKGGDGKQLRMDLLARTYRYLDEGEQGEDGN